MAKEIEIEAKNLVTKEEFERLCRHFAVEKHQFQTQTNFYFDTKQFLLRNQKTALRIRKKGDAYEMTLKQPNEVGLLETNEKITEEEAKKMIDEHIVPNGEIKRLLTRLIGNEPLSLIGQLTTQRAQIAYKGGTLVFDKSTYFDITDYEIEYEGKNENEVERIFSELLKEHHIERKQAENKIARLFAYKNSTF